jgi:hypothetical protein
MRLALTLLLITLMAALPLAAVTFKTAALTQAAGVRLDGGETVNIEEGQIVTGKVVNAEILAKLGLKGARNGDVMRILLLSQRDKKLKLMHVAGGGEVTFNYGKIVLVD